MSGLLSRRSCGASSRRHGGHPHRITGSLGDSWFPRQTTRLSTIGYCLVEANQTWAYRAPVLLLTVAKLQFEDGSPNRHALYDTGMAVENLALQATELGLVAHQMAGFLIDRARADCQIPEGYEPVAMMAIGYPGDPALLSDRLRVRETQPRDRKPVTEFVYATTWQKPSLLFR